MNSWSLNKETTNEVDAFQRKMLRRYVICKQYPQIVSNEEVHDITKQTIMVKNNRKKEYPSWHIAILRLDDERTPARKAYKYARGRQKTTLINCLKQSLANIDATLEHFESIAHDRQLINDLIKKL